MYIHQHTDWTDFRWDNDELLPLMGRVRYLQGRLLGQMEHLGFPLQAEAVLTTLTLDVLKSSEIEGELLNPEQVPLPDDSGWRLPGWCIPRVMWTAL